MWVDCEAGFVCKHLRAVKIVVRRELGADGDVTETKEVIFTEKKTYRQAWPKYNEAQMTEKDRFLALLFELCQGVQDFPQPAVGRRHVPLCDMIFAAAFKVYSTFSSRHRKFNGNRERLAGDCFGHRRQRLHRRKGGGDSAGIRLYEYPVLRPAIEQT